MKTNLAHEITPHLVIEDDRPHKHAPIANTRELMNLLLEDARNPKTKPVVRASLARSFAILCETLRVLQGKPSPGQLRPDLDPVQLSRALKRMKSRKPILDIGDGGSGPSEEPATTPATPTEKPAKVQASKATPPHAEPLPHDTSKPELFEHSKPELFEHSKASEQSNEEPVA